MAMTNHRQQLDNLMDAMVEDILSLSDEEVIQEMLEDLGSLEAVQAEIQRLHDMFETLIREAKAPVSSEAPEGMTEDTKV